jgi:NAD(P)-dependent dehydrogenase (short-subunit alcohol dehydrogenase family)
MQGHSEVKGGARMDDKVIVITGAAKGIGAGIALRAAQENMQLVLIDYDQQQLNGFVEEMKQISKNVTGVCLDISDIPKVRESIDRIIGDFSKIDVLVNNAGIMQTKSIFEIEEEDWDRVLNVNLKAMFFLSQAVGQHMVSQGSGSIVNIASVAARAPRPLAIHYGASKSGVLSLTRSMAEFFGSYGIRVNAVCPGAMDTEMIQRIGKERADRFNITPEEAIRDYVGNIPINRLGQPEDIAEMVLFLASDKAGYVSGQALNVCGGWQMV